MAKLVFAFFGFFAAQRFLLGDIYHYAPLAPLLCAIYWLFNSPKQAGIFVMMALFFTSDLGGEIYASTTSPVKYAIYLTAILVLVRLTSLRIQSSSALLGLALVALVAVTTFAYSLDSRSFWDTTSVIRDILILISIGFCLFNVRSGRFDLEPLYFASLGFLAGEVINLLLFFDRATHHYMSFASLKSFIIFPLFYRWWMDHRLTYFSIILVVPILLVMFAYNSKMVIFSLIFALLAVVVGYTYRRPSNLIWSLLGAFAVFSIFQTVLFLSPGIEANRIVAFIAAIARNEDLLANIEQLEPVRWQQHYLFFSRGFLEIIFGNGLGAGIYDTTGQLSNVANETAFTLEEMRGGVYFNFHDIWIDFGLRFGLISVLFIVFRLVKLLSDPSMRAMGAVFIMLLINATFTVSGVFMVVLFYKIILQQEVTNLPVRNSRRRAYVRAIKHSKNIYAGSR